MHCGPSTLLAEYRQKYWTPQLRQKIRNVILQDPETKCLACFTFIAKPANHPKEPDLPLQRLQLQTTFENTGIDFFGPFRVKPDSKMYAVIFACLTTRAIHLEICSDATTDRLLLAMRRFAARRGTPSMFLSDNAKQFILSADLLKRQWLYMLNNADLRNYMTKNDIEWRFVTERAPWRGGSYERLIGIIKAVLRRTVDGSGRKGGS